MSKGVTHAIRATSCICGCSRGACIPQRRYDQGAPLRPRELQEILFSVNGKCGYPLRDALKKQYTGLDERDEKVFPDYGTTTNVRLEVRLPTLARSDISAIR